MNFPSIENFKHTFQLNFYWIEFFLSKFSLLALKPSIPIEIKRFHPKGLLI